MFKLHTQVGEFRLDDPLLEPAWDRLEEAGIPIVVHVGSGPIGNAFTGPDIWNDCCASIRDCG